MRTPQIRLRHSPLARGARDPDVTTLAQWWTLSGRALLLACRRHMAEYRRYARSLGNIGVGKMWVEIALADGTWATIPSPDWVHSIVDAEREIWMIEWENAHPEQARAAREAMDREWDRMAGLNA